MDFAKIKGNLEKYGFSVSCFANKEDATKHLEETISGETIGFGGSVTVKEMGLYERLAKHNQVIWHWVDPKNRFRNAEFTAYVTSVNGIAETGEMINIDGSGNRLAASLFGPKKVYFVIGSNKIRPDLASAIERARNIASPLNAKRLNVPVPCAKDLRCHDCNSPERICRAMAIHMRPMVGLSHCEVALIDEELGY